MTSDKRSLDARAFALFEASLARPREERRAWIQAESGADSELCNRAFLILSKDEEDLDILRTGGAVSEIFTEEKIPDRIGVYRIVEKIGQGGMGSVYLAQRDVGDFNHQVAIKLIKPGLLGNHLKDRFLYEQQVLAGFNHPNIARLYDGGTTEDGEPYIIMEYINGRSVLDWVSQQNLGYEERLKLFLKICEAVAYAHRNLIIHRDLTPSNILVTEDGVIKLIDFGIARPYEDDGKLETSPGSLKSLSFTPGFAAPERSRGAGANTLSDIYSLGKILEAIIKTCPSTPELQAIINKATNESPDERFQSVNALMADITRYLGHYPLASYPGKASYRLGKFFRRNRAGSLFAILALISLVGGLVITAMMYEQAETARRDAELRFRQVRQLANSMMFDIFDEIAYIPGSAKAELKLAEAAQTYLDDLSADTLADPDLKLEAARGFRRLAEILGSPSIGTQMRIGEARSNLNSALALLVPLHRDYSKNREITYALNRTYYDLADIAMFAEHNLDDSFSNINKALAILADEKQQRPLNKKLASAMISTKSMKALAYGKIAAHGKAVKLAENVKQDILYLAGKYPDDRKIQRQLAISLNNLGRQFIKMERYSGARDMYSEALKVVGQLVGAEPENDLYQRDLAYTLWRRAHAYTNLRDGQPALRDFDRAVGIMGKLVRNDPNNKNYLSFFHVIRGERMLAFRALGDYRSAEKAGLQYVKDAGEFARKYPQDKNSVRDIMVAWWNLVDLYDEWDKPNSLCRSLKNLMDVAGQIRASGNLPKYDEEGLKQFNKYQQTCAPE